MARKLAQSTLRRLERLLEDERDRLLHVIDELEQELEEARATETAADRSSDPGSADAGSMRFEYEKELSVERNAEDLLAKVDHALRRLKEGGYGSCESCEEAIPVARLEVLPHATLCVSCAGRA